MSTATALRQSTSAFSSHPSVSSVSSAVESLSHLPHTAHPLPLREQAFTHHCQGLRSPAIAAELGVPERTVRAWIAAALDDLKDDIQLNRKQQLLLAVERQHQLTAAAWQQFEREAVARDALLDAALETLHASAAGTIEHPITIHLPASSLAPRYLSLILQADKEANRLLGLHTLAKLLLLTPDSTDTGPFPLTPSDAPAESATAPTPQREPRQNRQPLSPVSQPDITIPAESATDTPAESATDTPAESATDTPAESAADLTPSSSVPSVSSVVNSSQFSSVSSVLNPRPPAKTATAPSPTRRPHHPPRAPQPWMM